MVVNAIGPSYGYSQPAQQYYGAQPYNYGYPQQPIQLAGLGGYDTGGYDHSMGITEGLNAPVLGNDGNIFFGGLAAGLGTTLSNSQFQPMQGTSLVKYGEAVRDFGGKYMKPTTATRAGAGLSVLGAAFTGYEGLTRLQGGDTFGGLAGLGGLAYGAYAGYGSLAANGISSATSAAGISHIAGGAAGFAGMGMNVVDGFKSFKNGDYVGGAFTLGGTAIGFAFGGPIGGAIGGTIGKFVGGLFGGGKKKARKKVRKKLRKNMEKGKAKAYKTGRQKAQQLIASGQAPALYQALQRNGVGPSNGDPRKLSPEADGQLKGLAKGLTKKKKSKRRRANEQAQKLYKKEAQGAYLQGMRESLMEAAQMNPGILQPRRRRPMMQRPMPVRVIRQPVPVMPYAQPQPSGFTQSYSFRSPYGTSSYSYSYGYGQGYRQGYGQGFGQGFSQGFGYGRRQYSSYGGVSTLPHPNSYSVIRGA